MTWVSPLPSGKDWSKPVASGLNADEWRNEWSQWAALRICNATHRWQLCVLGIREATSWSDHGHIED